MKNKIAITSIIATSLVSTVLALDFKAGKVIEQNVPIEFSFTKDEVVEALKKAIKEKYPNADTSPTTNNVWIEKGKWDGTNSSSNYLVLTLYYQPAIIIPTKVEGFRIWTTPVNPHYWIYTNSNLIYK